MAEPPDNSVAPKSRRAWRTWLSKHFDRPSGVWLVLNKGASARGALDYPAAVEEALCFGWIDSKPGKLDETRSLLWMAPRSPKSRWSKLNKDRVEQLLAAGKMAPPGLAKVELAKRTGTWSALDGVEQLLVPPDLAKALRDHPPATELFAAFPKSVKRGILEWILSAKKPDTRAKRILETAELAAKNVRANQWRTGK